MTIISPQKTQKAQSKAIRKSAGFLRALRASVV